MTFETPTSFKLTIPTYSDSDIQESPWIAAVELKIWNTLASAIESSTFEPSLLAQEIDKLYPSNRPDGQGTEAPESFLLELWGIFAKAAGQVPVDHPGQLRLIELLTALRDLPNPSVVSELQGSWGTLKLWSDLPLMGAAFREALDVDTGANLQAFIARISSAGLAGFWFMALYWLNNALETKPEPRSTAYDNRGALLDSSVPSAALWIQLAGTKIYEMSIAEEMGDTTSGQGGLWKGKPGFSKGRWDLWKRRFGEIAGDATTKQETKDVALKAKETMEHADGSV